MLKISIYLSNLGKYTAGEENGKWISLPMESDKLNKVFNTIVGESQEWIILDYNAPFDISEYENIFSLNEFMENINENGIDETTIKIIFRIADTKEEAKEKLENGDYFIINVDEVSNEWNTGLCPEEIYGMVLNEEGYNNLFEKPIPEDMIDYIDFKQVWTSLSVNDGWEEITIDNNTCLVTIK